MEIFNCICWMAGWLAGRSVYLRRELDAMCSDDGDEDDEGAGSQWDEFFTVNNNEFGTWWRQIDVQIDRWIEWSEVQIQIQREKRYQLVHKQNRTGYVDA